MFEGCWKTLLAVCYIRSTVFHQPSASICVHLRLKTHFSLRGPRDRELAQHKGAQLAEGAYLLDLGVGNFYRKKILHEKYDFGDGEGIEAEVLDEAGVVRQRA